MAAALDDSEHGSALVLFSGGQDSTTCLAWALERYARVETIGFDYGQRHRVELECRPTILSAMRASYRAWRDRLGADHVTPLGVLEKISETALTRDTEITMGANGLPTTFVPGRNLLFLVVAAAVGYRRGIDVLVGGMCETDFSGYPDCRNDTMKAVEAALRLGMERPVAIETPLMWIDKRATWALAETLGGERLVEIVLEHTHTCYRGERGLRHDWGYGCGACPACELRRNGYRSYISATGSGGGAPASRS